VALITNAYKGLAMGVLLVVIMSVIIAVVFILIISGQTDFISKTARFLGSLLTVRLP